jgi:hypothetical protein
VLNLVQATSSALGEISLASQVDNVATLSCTLIILSGAADKRCKRKLLSSHILATVNKPRANTGLTIWYRPHLEHGNMFM